MALAGAGADVKWRERLGETRVAAAEAAREAASRAARGVISSAQVGPGSYEQQLSSGRLSSGGEKPSHLAMPLQICFYMVCWQSRVCGVHRQCVYKPHAGGQIGLFTAGARADRCDIQREAGQPEQHSSAGRRL